MVSGHHADSPSNQAKKSQLMSQSDSSPLDDYWYNDMDFVEREDFLKNTEDIDVVHHIVSHGNNWEKGIILTNPVVTPSMVDTMIQGSKSWEAREKFARFPGISEKSQEKLMSHKEDSVLTALASNPTVPESRLFELSKFRFTNWSGRRNTILIDGAIKNVMDNPNVSDRCFNRIYDEINNHKDMGNSVINMKIPLMKHPKTPGNILRSLYENSHKGHTIQRPIMNNPNTPQTVYDEIVDNPSNEHVAAELISMERTTPEQALRLKNDPSDVVQEAYRKRFG